MSPARQPDAGASTGPQHLAADDPDPRATFDEAAELYDRARPGYPPRLFDDLAELAKLRPGAGVLEIGCGTGQATLPLAERGYAVVGVELGPRLADVARRKLARFASVEIVVAAFEDWPLPSEPFDAVVAATAWHWLDPRVRLAKVAAALAPGGALATIATHHVAGGTQDFFVEVQHCYERWDPRTPPGLRLPNADTVPPQADELDQSDQFEPPMLRRYAWQETYTTATYLDAPDAPARGAHAPAGVHRSAHRCPLRRRHQQVLPDRTQARPAPPDTALRAGIRGRQVFARTPGRRVSQA